MKEKDILRFLEGKSDKHQKKAIKSWAKSTDSNKKELNLYKKIHKEAPNLESFNLVDEVEEWKEFLDKSKPDVSDLQVLNYLDGFSNYSEKKAVESWAEEDATNARDLDVYKTILSHSRGLEGWRTVDENLEWSSLQSKLQVGASPEESQAATINLQTESFSSKRRIIPLWQRYAAAAAIAILLTAVIWFALPKETYTEYATTNNTHTVQMEDGSTIELAENTVLRYPKRIKKASERRLYLKGQGRFNVAEDNTRPFIVEVNDLIGIEVLGTIFKVNDHDVFLEIVENVQGKVRAYVLSNPSISVELEAGDRYGYDGKQFVNLNAKPEVVDKATDHQILKVLDYLMEQSQWRVITSPYADVDEEAIVRIDLDQDYEKILEDLKERADFEYDNLTCEGCFVIYRFRPFEEVEANL